LNRNATIVLLIVLFVVGVVVAVVLPRLSPQARASAIVAVSSSAAANTAVVDQTEVPSTTSTRPVIGLTPVDPTFVAQPFETPIYTITPSRATFDVSSREAVLKIWSKIPSRLGDMDASFTRPLEELSSESAMIGLSKGGQSLGVLILLSPDVSSGYLTFEKGIHLNGTETKLVPVCDHAYVNKLSTRPAVMVCANATFLIYREPTSRVDDSEVEQLVIPVLYDLSVLFS